MRITIEKSRFKLYFWSLFLAISITWVFYLLYDNLDSHEKHDIYYNTAQVVGLGQCSKNQCSFQYQTSTGETKFGVSDSPVSLGQEVYQMCWTEKARGHMCYVNYDVRK